MAVGPIAQSGVQGVREGFVRAQDAAERIAGSSLSSGLDDIVEAAVDLEAAELQVKASTRLIEAENNTVGHLIDIFA